MKKVLLSVSCINVHVDDFPGLYCAELTAETIARIMHLNRMIKDLHADEISEFNSCGVWSHADTRTPSNFDDACSEDAAIDIPRLVVSNTYFY